MIPRDIPKAFTLTNQYTSQFEIAQVFKSEEEFSHWFLSPLVDNMATYVVEEPNNGNITDMFSFRTCKLKSEKIAQVIALVITSFSAKEIIADLVVCTQQENATIVILPRFGLKRDLFKNFLQEHSVSTAEFSMQIMDVVFSIIINILKLMMTITVCLDQDFIYYGYRHWVAYIMNSCLDIQVTSYLCSY